MDKVSIVIPVYNASKYLAPCIESIIRQTYSEIEIIFIDDGSKDNSRNIINKYKKEDSRIKLICQDNKGVSIARNLGVSMSTGVYLIFVDADDILPVDSIEKRLNCIRDADLAVCGYATFGEDGKLLFAPLCKEKEWAQEEAFKNIVLDGTFGYQGYLWNKIYRTDIIKKYNVKFVEKIAYNEDKLFNVTYILNCKKTYILNDCVYMYRVNQDSAMGKLGKINDSNILKIISEFNAFDKILEIIKEYYMELYCAESLYAYDRARTIIQFMRSYHAKKTRKYLNRQIRKYGYRVIKYNRGEFSGTQIVKIVIHMIIGR